MMFEQTRLQKYLSQKGIFSRRETEGYIREGRLKINSKIAKLGDRVTPTDKIFLDNKPINIKKNIENLVIAYHKPKGLETTLAKAEDHKTLANIDFGVGKIFPIGRLDKDSHGLLLLTNNGDLGNKLMHPKYQKEKVYEVKLNKKMDYQFMHIMETGVKILGKRTSPCEVKKTSPASFEITLKEGRNRQIRRMCGALGYTVIDLKRIRFGNIELGSLEYQKFRKLSQEEVSNLENL